MLQWCVQGSPCFHIIYPLSFCPDWSLSFCARQIPGCCSTMLQPVRGGECLPVQFSQSKIWLHLTVCILHVSVQGIRALHHIDCVFDPEGLQPGCIQGKCRLLLRFQSRSTNQCAFLPYFQSTPQEFCACINIKL